MGTESQPLLIQSCTKRKWDIGYFRPICIFRTAAMERSRSSHPYFLLKIRKQFRHRRFRRPEKDDWLGDTDQSESRSDTSDQWHHQTHTWMDSYPYNSISIYALHPMYIDLSRLSPLKDKDKAAYFNRKQKELNTLPTLNYEEEKRQNGNIPIWYLNKKERLY